MNRRPNAPKCILGVVMVVLLVVGGLATTNARLSTTIASTTVPARAASAMSPLQSPCGPTIPPALCNTFEIEGNAVDDTGFPGLPEDWNDVYSSAETNAVPPQGSISGAPTTASVATVRAFANDTGANDQIFTQGGSKDFNEITDWRHTTGSVPDKDEITHAGAARYTDPTTGHEVLAFFADRFDNSGDANIGFWFFKNAVGVNADGTFSGTHAIGDIFIISAFTKGGGTSTIQVFKWVGSQAATQCLPPGVIDPKSDTPAFPNGTLCNITAVPSGGTSAGSGIVNGGAITVNWPYSQKGGSACNSGPCSIPQKGLFFEGGIDLTSLGLGGECFASFMTETRSSADVSAVLKDFTLGNFQQCSLTCSKSANPTTVCAGGSTTYTYSVTNPGGVALTTTVTDDNGTPGNAADDFGITFNADGTCGTAPAGTSFNLAPGATKTCTRLVTNLQATVTNTIHVVGTSAGGTQLTCDSSATVTVNPQPGAPTTQGASRCGPGVVNLSAGNCTGTLTWYDAASGGNVVNTGTTFSPNLNATTTFYVSCTSAAGCEGPRTAVTGTINPVPGAPSTTGAARCGPGVVALSAGGCTGTLKWYDAATGGNVVNTGTSFSPNLNATTTYYVSCTNAFGCEGPRTSVTGTINPVPSVAITANACATSITLTATVTSGTANFTYHWTGPGGLDVTHGPTSSSTDTLDVTVPGSYTVAVSDANSCGGSRNGTVGVCLVSTQAASAASTQVRAPKAKKRNR